MALFCKSCLAELEHSGRVPADCPECLKVVRKLRPGEDDQHLKFIPDREPTKPSRRGNGNS